MMLTELEQALLEGVKTFPGSTAGEIAGHLRLDPSNARRDLKRLCGYGKITGQREQGGRQTIRFYPANGHTIGQGPTPSYSKAHSQSPQIIDGDYTVLSNEPAPHSDSTSLVVHHGAEQPADSRRFPGSQLADSRHLPGTMTGAFAVPDTRRNGYVVDPRFFPALNSAFLDDGDGALNALAVAVDRNTRAVWSAQNQAAQLAAQQRAEQAEREKAEEEKRREQEMHEVMQRMLSRSSREDDTEQEKRPSLLEEARRAREQRRLEIAEVNERLYQESVAKQKQQFPPDKYPHLYEDEDELAEPPSTAQTKTMAALLDQTGFEPDKGAFWKDFALAGAVVIAFVGVLKFAGGLA